MYQEDFSSYSKIKRLADSDLEALWQQYFQNKTEKKVRDALIVQYIYLIRYVVGRVKVALPTTFSVEDISSYGVEGLIDAIEKYSPDRGAMSCHRSYLCPKGKGQKSDENHRNDIQRQKDYWCRLPQHHPATRIYTLLHHAILLI